MPKQNSHDAEIVLGIMISLPVAYFTDNLEVAFVMAIGVFVCLGLRRLLHWMESQ